MESEHNADTAPIKITLTITTATDADAESLAVAMIEELNRLGHEVSAEIHDTPQFDGGRA